VGEQVTNIGIVGTGVISGTYLDHLGKKHQWTDWIAQG